MMAFVLFCCKGDVYGKRLMDLFSVDCSVCW